MPGNSTSRVLAVGALVAAASANANGCLTGLDLLQSVQKKGSANTPIVSKQDIWLEDRSVGRLHNTRGHLSPTTIDKWQGFYAAEVAAYSC